MHRLLSKLYHHHHHPFHLLQRELNHELSRAPSVFSLVRNLEGAIENPGKVSVSPARVHRHDHNHHGLWSHHHHNFWRNPLAVDWAPFNLSIDVRTTLSTYSIDATLPGGAKKGDVNLSLNSKDRILTIKVNRVDKNQSSRKAEGIKVEDVTQTEAKSDELTASSQAKADVSANQPSSNQSEYSYRESFVGSVERQVLLPEDANLDGLAAKFQDGIITIDIPKVEPVNYNRTISLD